MCCYGIIVQSDGTQCIDSCLTYRDKRTLQAETLVSGPSCLPTAFKNWYCVRTPERKTSGSYV